MNIFKKIGTALLGLSVFAAIILVFALLFVFGTKLAFKIEPVVNWIAAIFIIVDVVIVLPLMIFRKTRIGAATVMTITSYIFGLATWLYGFAATLTLLGVGWLIIGLFFAGVGVVPLGMIGALIHHHPGIFWGLLVNLILTFGTRILGLAVLEKSAGKEESASFNFIDIDNDDSEILNSDSLLSTAEITKIPNKHLHHRKKIQ